MTLLFSFQASHSLCRTSFILLAMLALNGCDSPAKSIDDKQGATEQTVSSVNHHDSATLSDSALSQGQHAPLTILALGDSLTEGLGVAEQDNYPAQLQARLKEKGYQDINVINSGLSGETSTGLVNRLDWALQTKPDVTILTIGANDAIRGIDVATVEANIRTIVKRLQNNGSQVILGGMQIYDNLGTDYVQSFADMYPRIAKDMHLTMIPFFLKGVAGDAKLNQADAIHPTKAGYTLIVDNNVLPVLEPVLKKTLMTDASGTIPANLPAPTETAP